MTIASASHLAVLGDLVLDVVATSRQRVMRGSDVPGTVRFRAGGSAANTARAFARLGGRATLIGVVGQDTWGRRLVRSLRADGVRVRQVTVEGTTARLMALVGPDGERSFVTERGVADRLAATDLDARWLRGVDALHLPAYSLFAEPLAGAARRAATIARERGAIVTIDLASRAPLLAMGRGAARQVIRSVGPGILFANRDEAGALYRRRPASRLTELAPIVVIKEGSAGCRILVRDVGAVTAPGAASKDGVVKSLSMRTRPITTPDTTGAGDAFDAGFLYALLRARRAPMGELPHDARSLRLAAAAGHRAAARLLREPRAEIAGA